MIATVRVFSVLANTRYDSKIDSITTQVRVARGHRNSSDRMFEPTRIFVVIS